MSSLRRESADAATREERTAPARPITELHAVARGSLANLVGLVVAGVFQLLLVAVVAHALGARRTGIFFSAIALFMIVSNTGELGADTGLVRYVSRFRSLGRAADVPGVTIVGTVPVFVVATILAVLLFVYAGEIAAVFSRNGATSEVASYVRVLAPFVPVASMSTVILSATRGFGTMAPFVYIQNIAVPTIRPIVIAALIAAGVAGTAIVAAWALPLVAALVVGALALLTLLRRDGWDGRAVTTRRDVALDFWKFTAPRALAGAFGVLISWLDILLVNALRSASEAGVYASVSRLSITGAYALNAMGMAIAPQMSFLLARRRSREAGRVLQVATPWLMALTWPMYIAIAVFGDVILRAIGSDLSGGYTALIILAFAQVVNVGTGNVVVVLLMAGRSSWALINSAVALALNIGLNVLLIPRFGINGAAIAWMASIVYNNVSAVVMVRILGITPFGRAHTLIAVAATACFGILGLAFRLVLGATPASLAAFAVTSTGAYAVVLWRLRHRLELPTLVGSIARHQPDLAA